MSEIDLIREIQSLERRLKRLEAGEFATGEWTYLQTPLTSTSWDGDAYSTTATTKIDLSAVFGVPAGVRAILVRVVIRDSGSAGAASELLFGLGPNNGIGLTGYVRVDGAGNDLYRESTMVIPCNTDGDVYYAVTASGAATMDVIIRIWGYYR